jgi:predicted small metal-binding protein
MDDQQMADVLTVRCVCGWEVRGSKEEVVAATSEHGDRLHNMAATREQILAMAVPPAAAAAPGATAAPGGTPT